MGKKFWANIILVVFIGGAASIVLANMDLTSRGVFVTPPEPSDEAAGLMNAVLLADFNLNEGQDHMVTGEFIIHNRSDQEVKNIDILCEFTDKNGKYLDRERWLLNARIPAGKAMRHMSSERRFVHTDSSNLQCAIVDFAIAQPTFFALHRVEGGHGNEEGSATGHGASANGHH